MVVSGTEVILRSFTKVRKSENVEMNENNESEEDCIKREIKEEINIEINLVKRLTPSLFDYPNISIELIPFIANYTNGEIILNEHKQYLLLKM